MTAVAACGSRFRGSVYPALAQLEDEGLIALRDTDGARRGYGLTDEGRAYVAASAAVDMRMLVHQVQLAAFQVISAGTDDQAIAAARHMKAYREAGYRVEAMILAVPAAMSNQGIIARYHEQVTDRGHRRLPVQANADRAYAGILDLADLIETGRLADETTAFRRDEAAPRYPQNLNQAGQWTSRPALRAAAEAERGRARTRRRDL